MSSAAPARDGVALASLVFFGLALGFVGLRGLHQGHFDHAVSWQGQPLGFVLQFIGWMLGCALCLGLSWALWRRSLAPDARLWQDTAPLPRQQPVRLTLHERPRGALRRWGGLVLLLLFGLGLATLRMALQPLLGPALWVIVGPGLLGLAYGLLRWLLWQPAHGPVLSLGPQGLQDHRCMASPIAWADIQAMQLDGAGLQLALHGARRAAVLRQLGWQARWTAWSLRWNGEGADVMIPLQGLERRPGEVLARARDWQGWVLGGMPDCPPG